MIAKLMSRKKSYERIMRMEDSLQARHQPILNSELSQKKSSEVLIMGSRGTGVSGMSRAL